MDRIFDLLSRTFDRIYAFWEKEATHRFVSVALIVIFIMALCIIEANRQGWLPPSLKVFIPSSHFMAINLAFTLVLILEVISLIFTLPASMSRAVGKQFEILALIFLRNSFKELAVLPEPIDISGHHDVLWHIMAYGTGAVTLFAILGVYFLLRRNLDEVISSGPSLERFIKAKKSVAFLMLTVFIGLGGYDGWLLFSGGHHFDFFHSFYTMLIFSDILLVLIAQSFLPKFHTVFRNSGYALSTLMIRLSLTAPVYYNVMLGIFAILFALVLTLVYNRFYSPREH